MLSTVIPGYYTGVFIFAILLSACLVIYHIYDSLYTKTTDSLFMIMIFGLGIYLMHDAAVPYGIIIMAFFMALRVTHPCVQARSGPNRVFLSSAPLM